LANLASPVFIHYNVPDTRRAVASHNVVTSEM